MYNGFIITDNMKNTRIYDGATLKFGITENEADYIVKLPRGGISSTLSEYVSSRFIAKLGITCHEVWLGYYNNNLVSIIKDFTTPELRLRSYKDTRQSSEDTDTENKEYTYSDVIHMIDRHSKMDQQMKQATLNRFWAMFLCDAILGNRDRHAGNWGYLMPKQGSYIPAPIYDNGGSLFPGVDRVIGEFSLNELKFIYNRDERFPASVFRVERQNGEVKKTNYYDILSNISVNKALESKVIQLKENVGFYGIMKSILDILRESAQFIPSIYSRFYATIIGVRYLHIIERITIEKAYEMTRGIIDGI